MSKRKRFIKKDYETWIISGTITNEPEYSSFGDKNKVAFEIVSQRGNTALCVYWHKVELKKGDVVSMKGHFKNGVFLVWSLLKNYTVTVEESKEEVNENRQDENNG